MFSCRCLHVPPPWGHHTGDPPPGQRALQAGPSSDVGSLRGGGTRLPHHQPLVLLLFLLKGTHMSLLCVAGVRGTHYALHCGRCGCALGGKLLEATEGGAGFRGCACPTSGETSTFQGMLALGGCIGLNPCGFPQGRTGIPSSPYVPTKKMLTSHLPCGSPATEGLTTPPICACLVKTCSPSAPILTLLMVIMRNGFK